MRIIRDTRVCVIGGVGFLGSHMVEHLIRDRNCYVLTLDNLTTGCKEHLYPHPDAEFIEYDIRRDEDQLTNILDRDNIEYVFNYAAEPFIPECFERPLYFFDVNATAVLRVLNAVQASKSVKGLLQVSSAEIYGDMKGKISESAPIKPHSTYGVSKVAADGLVRVRWREAQVPAIALRQFNCVGERETHEYVVPEIISQLQSQVGKLTTPVVNLGNNSYRDFLYAGDAVRMAVELLEKGQFGEVYNLGSELGLRIYDLAIIIARLMGIETRPVIAQEPSRVRPWEIWHLQSDNGKIYSVIESRPQVSLEEALRRTIDYYRSNGCRWGWEPTAASAT